MTDDLVSGLLAAIEQRETAAKRALAGYPADDYNMESAYLTRVWKSRYHEVEAVMTREPTPEQLAVRTRNPRVELVADCGPANVYPARHIALNDPQSVLRLCQAHRKIIDMYQQAKARPVCREGREARLRGLDHASAMGRLTTLGLALQVLAEGYGLTEGEQR
jgi:hypothetical protein